jgi:fructokinase
MIIFEILKKSEADVKPVITAYGEALWDLLPEGPVLGGALLNFTYRAKSLGADAECISRLGMDDLGDRAAGKMNDLGFDMNYIQRDSAHSTGTVPVSFDEQKNPSYVITPEVAFDFIEDTENLEARIQQSDCLCFGSLIQRAPVSRETLYKLIEQFGGRYLLFDINLRKDCYSSKTVRTSLEKCHIAKLNEDELHELKELIGISGNSVRKLTQSCVETYGLTYCLVTLGDKGLFAAADSGTEVYVPGIVVDLVDPIGAGDACTAGFIFSLLQDSPLDYACKYANAIGAAVAETSGATGFVSKERIEAVLRGGDYSEPHPEFRRKY